MRLNASVQDLISCYEGPRASRPLASKILEEARALKDLTESAKDFGRDLRSEEGILHSLHKLLNTDQREHGDQEGAPSLPSTTFWYLTVGPSFLPEVNLGHASTVHRTFRVVYTTLEWPLDTIQPGAHDLSTVAFSKEETMALLLERLANEVRLREMRLSHSKRDLEIASQRVSNDEAYLAEAATMLANKIHTLVTEPEEEALDPPPLQGEQ